MKVIVLTTNTPHHVYYVNRIHAELPIDQIYLEQKGFPSREMYFKNIRRSIGVLSKIRAIFLSPYLNYPLFDKRALTFEREHFCPEVSLNLPNTVPSKKVYNVNAPEVVDEIEALKPDVILVFGTGVIKPPLIRIPSKGIFNVHRGILPYYRGLDSDLWAIFHKRLDLIGTTLHFVNEGLDTGHIVAQRTYRMKPSDKIYHLRYYTTVIAADLTLEILKKLQEGISLDAKEQDIKEGIELSFMPLLIKLFTYARFYFFREARGGIDVKT